MIQRFVTFTGRHGNVRHLFAALRVKTVARSKRSRARRGTGESAGAGRGRRRGSLCRRGGRLTKRVEGNTVIKGYAKGKRSAGRRRASRGLRCDPLNKKLKPERRAADQFLRRRNLIIYKK
ncbi:hypothetical protein EVAR_65639_1 [Eumeta japonica]|uniref:Uncharacterized protein n=1 Tax=Eumeta variegata TaxID=151549 RepID=A0A4C1Z444_EUMVA|nr:hypothetical protein EVAR_65639_1 [Eumeta japonica]